MNRYAVIDFKTTGPSTEHGDRPIEVAVVKVERGQVMDCYHSVMNAEVPIPEAIQSLTGLSEARIRQAPSASKVMKAVAKLIGNLPLVAHNWGFHGRFLVGEWQRIQVSPPPTGVCSLLLSRRLYPEASDHKLGTLCKHFELPRPQGHLTALRDAEMTAQVMIQITQDLKRQYQLKRVPYDLLCRGQKASKANFAQAVQQTKQELGL